MPGDQLSSVEAAKLIGIPPSTWRSLLARGQAPPPADKIGNANWWWRTTIEEYIEQKQAKA